MINDFIKFDRVYWVSVIITLIVSYAFMLTNPAVSLEDFHFQYYFFDGYVIQQGRWGSFPLRRILNTYMFLPFWRPFIGLAFMVAGFTLFSGILKKYSNGKFNNIACAIFTCIGISFPIIPEFFVLMTATVDMGMMIFFSGLSLLFSIKWVIDKARIIYGVVGAALFGYALAFTEHALTFWSVAAFSVLMVSFITSQSEGNGSVRKDILMFLKLAAIAAAGSVFWRLAGFIIQMLTGHYGIGYIDIFINHDTSSPTRLVISVLRYIVTFPKNIILTDDVVMDILIISATVSLLVIGIVFSIIKKRPVIFLAALLSVVSAYMLFLLTGREVFPVRFLIGFSILFALSASILYTLAPKKYMLKTIVLVACVYLVFFQTREMNRSFYVNHLRYQNDVFVMETTIRDLGGWGGYKPVLFVGAVPQSIPVQSRFQFESLIGYSALNFGRSVLELDPMRVYGFFEMHGFPIPHHPDFMEADLDLIATQVIGMPNWPQPGYIREFEDYTIVKLGPSVFDRKQGE